jgi:hypothetical protein
VVSTDGGATWANIETDKSTTTDPNGQNFGFGITGSSGDHVPGGRRRLAGKYAVLPLHLQSGPDRCYHAALQQPAVRAPEPAGRASRPSATCRPTLSASSQPEAPIVTPLAFSAMSAPGREWDTVPVLKHTDIWIG